MDEALAGIHPDGPDRDPFDRPGDFMPKTYMRSSTSTPKRRKTRASAPDPPAEPEEPSTPPARETPVVEISSSPPSMADDAPANDSADTDDLVAAPENTPTPVTSPGQSREPTMVPLGAGDPGPATAMRTDDELEAYIATQTLSCM